MIKITQKSLNFSCMQKSPNVQQSFLFFSVVCVFFVWDNVFDKIFLSENLSSVFFQTRVPLKTQKICRVGRQLLDTVYTRISQNKFLFYLFVQNVDHNLSETSSKRHKTKNTLFFFVWKVVWKIVENKKFQTKNTHTITNF